MAEQRQAPTLQDIAIVRMTGTDLLEVVELNNPGLSRWGWAALYAELQGGNRDLMLIAKPSIVSAPSLVISLRGRRRASFT